MTACLTSLVTHDSRTPFILPSSSSTASSSNTNNSNNNNNNNNIALPSFRRIRRRTRTRATGIFVVSSSSNETSFSNHHQRQSMSAKTTFTSSSCSDVAMMSIKKTNARIALVQLASTPSKEENIKNMLARVEEAISSTGDKPLAGEGEPKVVDIVVLPEMWNCPYGNEFFAPFAEEVVIDRRGSHAAEEDGRDSTSASPSFEAMRKIAKEKKVVLFGGSIPTRKDGKLFNTCFVFDSDGTLIATHHKLHLFDVDIPDGITFFESKTLTAGDAVTIANTKEFGKFGVGICFDLRFPEYARACALEGCVGMIYPGAFNTVTGPLHWALLQRCRAVDNQMFVATCSPSRVAGASYQAHGDSSVYGPFGEKLNDKELEEKPGVVYADLDFTEIEKRRSAMPLNKQRRLSETYELHVKEEENA